MSHEHDHEYMHEHDIPHDHDIEHAHTHGGEQGHDHPHGEAHAHEHTHTHAHEHTHADGTTHSHPHEHAHSHEHGHPHDHNHGHAHPHTHEQSQGCPGAASCGKECASCDVDPKAELMALMQYMVNHNAAHANELAQLAGRLKDMGDPTGYEQVMQAVSDFEKGNMRLSTVLAAMK